MAHGAIREHSDGGQCEHSWSGPGVQEGVADDDPESWLVSVEPWAAVVWLSQWGPTIGEAQLMLVLIARRATITRRASRRDCG